MKTIQRIACVGEAMIELSMIDGSTAQVGVAGDTFNTAVYLRRSLPFAVSVSFVTALGDEAMSAKIADALTAEGINTDLIERRTGAMPGLYLISVDERGERSFSYWRSASAARTLFSAQGSDAFEALYAFDIVYVSGISIAILPPNVRGALCAWVDDFRARGGRLAFDSNYRHRLWEDQATAKAATMEMWRRTDIALPSVDDEMALFEDASEAAVVQRLLDAGITFGALKRGDAGPVALDGSGATPASEPVKTVIDSTAAGDSFNAGFLAAVATGADIVRCMEDGHRLASKVIQHKGAIIPRNS